MTDHLLQLAPDAKTLEAGRRLFYSRRWRLLGGDGQWVWGEFDYNGRRAIESAVEVVQGKFHCSCRARARPCAHNLALVLLLKNNADRFHVGQPPDWVRSVQHRAGRAPPPVKDERAADDRLSGRLALMTAGLDELELRLLDLARTGIAETAGQGTQVWLDIATRLTDNKLPGLAARIRRLASLPEAEAERAIARTLGDLFLFIRAWRFRDEFPPERVEELYQVAGITTRRDELAARPAREDHWLVVGVVEGEEDRLRYRRAWLRGERSKRYALLLDFTFGHNPFEQSWPLSASFDGAVQYYPGAYPQRAVFTAPRAGGRPYDGLIGYPAFAEMRANYRCAVGVNPWLQLYPVLLAEVRPVKLADDLYLVDKTGEAFPVDPTYAGFYRLLAVSGGGSLTLFAEFDGYRLRPLSLLTGQGLVTADQPLA